jgi:hypothetical protein
VSRYFKRLAQRTSVLDTMAIGRQATPAKSDLKEIHHQQVEAHAPAMAHTVVISSESVMGTASNLPTKVEDRQTEAVGVATSIDGQDPRPSNADPEPSETPNPLFSAKSADYPDTNPRIEDRIVEDVAPQKKRPSSQDTEAIAKSGQETIFTPVHEVSRYDRTAAGPMPNKPTRKPQSSGAKETVRIDQSDHGITSWFDPPGVEPSPRGHLVTRVRDDIKKTNQWIRPQSSPPMPSNAAPAPIVEKPYRSEKYQGIEISIGSINMEVHQKQPAVATIPPQPKAMHSARGRPADQPSPFRPCRYYLRGI